LKKQRKDGSQLTASYRNSWSLWQQNHSH